MNDIPEDAIILPNEELRYLAVWQTETRLVISLLNMRKTDQYDIKLDKKILPHLVDALIELQNQ